MNNTSVITYPNTISFEILIRSIKILDIGFITIIYFIFAILVAKLLNYFFGTYKHESDKNKSKYIVGLELCGIIWLMGVSTYLIRNLVELIPSPFENVYEFHHHKVKELSSAGVYTLILYQSFSYFKLKLESFLLKTNEENKN